MDTFGSASFLTLITKPDSSYSSEITENHIPGGSINYIDIGGRLPNHVDLALYFDAASSFLSFANMTSTSNTLITCSASYANAVLISIQRTWLNHNCEQCTVDASFVVP